MSEEAGRKWKVETVKPGALPTCVVTARDATEAEKKYRERFPLAKASVPVKVTPLE